jgi:hypothetical protein
VGSVKYKAQQVVLHMRIPLFTGRSLLKRENSKGTSVEVSGSTHQRREVRC